MTIVRYVLGFVLSLALTVIAYVAALNGKDNSWLIAILGLLAVLQMIVQLVFFLHIDDESGPRYKLWSFIFMAGTLLIIVVGSLWIMYNMNYNMLLMTPDQKNAHMLIEHDKGF